MSIRTWAFTCVAVAIAAALSGPAHAVVRWPRPGVELGPGLARMPDFALVEGHEHWTAGMVAGALASWDAAPGWTVELAPRWERLVGRTTGTISGVGDWDQRIRFDRIALPIRSAYHFGSHRLALEAGVEPAWLAHAGRDASITVTAPLTASRPVRPAANIFEGIGTFDSTDWTRFFHRWDVSVAGGVGWDQPVGLHVVRLRARWQQGLVDIGTVGEPVRLSAAEATIGLMW